MTTAIDWEPFLTTLQVFAAFILLCFLATVADIWMKGSRKPKPSSQPVALINGEKVYLN